MIFWPRWKPFNISPREGPFRRLQKHKFGIFRDAAKYPSRNESYVILVQKPF